jgi:hypothetical protein
MLVAFVDFLLTGFFLSDGFSLKPAFLVDAFFIVSYHFKCEKIIRVQGRSGIGYKITMNKRNYYRGVHK